MEESLPDFTSNMPLDILQQIASLLPTKEALRTSILSTSWKSLWKPLLVFLEADSDHIISHQTCDVLKQIVASFLKTHDAPRQLKISLSQPEKMIVLATKGVYKELYLDFSTAKEEPFSSKFTLESSCLPSCNMNPIEMSGFLALRTLHLRSLAYFAESFASALFSNCYLLESFKLEKCSGLQNIKIKASRSLQKIELSDCPDVASITIAASNLKTFYYKGVLPEVELEGCSLLADVKVNVGDGLGLNEIDCGDVLSFLASLKDVEFLTISGWLIEWLCTVGVIFGKLDFQFSKLKKLWWIHSVMDCRNRDSLACFLSITTLLEMLFIDIEQACTAMPSPCFHQCWHEFPLWVDYSTVKRNASQLKYLKMVKIMGFSNNEDELILMDLLLHMALNLKAMIVTSLDNKSWKVSKIPRSQIPYVKDFSTCMLLSSPNVNSPFVLRNQYDNELAP